MAFAEVRVDEGLIVYKTSGGTGFSTKVVTVQSGRENRNALWSYPKGRWDLGQREMLPEDLRYIIDFFNARRGMFEGFRFKDFTDFKATHSPSYGRGNNTYDQGVISGVTPGIPNLTNNGSGYPTLQLGKIYSSGSSTQYRLIQKPVAGTLVAYRNGSQMTVGSGAGNYTIDTTTGILTMVADHTVVATSITTGTTTQIVFASSLGLSIGQLMYLNGFAGADAGLVNGLVHTISNVSGTGPYTYTLSTNTNGKTITVGSPIPTGTGYAYPQLADSFTADFEFDVPVRFDVDMLTVEFTGAYISIPGTVDAASTFLPTAPIIEIRV